MIEAVSINVATNDQGLAEILKQAQVQEEVVEYITTTCELNTTTDLLNYFPKATFETEVADLIKDKFGVTPSRPVERQRLYISRLRSAFQLAHEVRDRIIKAKDQPDDDNQNPDIERPLDAKTVVALEVAWKAVHPFKFIPQRCAAPAFRNRVYREIKTASCKVIPVEKVRTVDDTRSTQEPATHQVGSSNPDGGRLLFEVAKKTTRTVRSVFDYLTSLTILMRTYAYCGTHQVPATGATLLRDSGSARLVTFFSYSAALTYVDELTAAVQSIEIADHEKLAWLRRRDETVRSEMASLINEGTPGDEALQSAFSKYKHMFIMRDTAAAASMTSALAVWEPHGTKRPREEARGNKGQSKGKGKKGKDENPMRRASQVRGIKLCGAFNAPTGHVESTAGGTCRIQADRQGLHHRHHRRPPLRSGAGSVERHIRPPTGSLELPVSRSGSRGRFLGRARRLDVRRSRSWASLHHPIGRNG